MSVRLWLAFKKHKFKSWLDLNVLCTKYLLCHQGRQKQLKSGLGLVLIRRPQSVKIEPSGSSSQHVNTCLLNSFPHANDTRKTFEYWLLDRPKVVQSKLDQFHRPWPSPNILRKWSNTEGVWWRCVVKVWVAGNPLTLTNLVPRPHPAVHVEESLGVWATPGHYCY